MFAVVDDTKYGELLTKFSPRKIQSEEQNERYLSFVEDLMDKGAENFTPEEHELFDLLVTLIEDFEEKTYSMPKISPYAQIKHLLKERGIKQKDLIPIFGSAGVVSDTINGKRSITLKTANKLADFFQIPVDFFI